MGGGGRVINNIMKYFSLRSLRTCISNRTQVLYSSVKLHAHANGAHEGQLREQNAEKV